MIFIAHRGNINGKIIDKENHPDYLMQAINQGYHVEVDTWMIDNKIYLGHDGPQYEVTEKFLLNDSFWCHAKNLEMIHYFSKLYPYLPLHYFFHDTDACTLTSKGWIWTYPGRPILSCKAVAVMPEIVSNYDISLAGAICSDIISHYKNI